ncbi:hypothetical protein D9M70_529880 [compost metagenome]
MPVSYIVNGAAATSPGIACNLLMPGIQAINAKSRSSVIWERAGCRDDMDMVAGSVPQKDASSLSRIGFCLGMRKQKFPDGPLD